MSIDIKAPQFPESVAEGSVASWHKRPGEACRRDEVVADIETDKVVLEVVAPADGAIAEILKDTGATVLSQEVIARFVAGATAAAPDSAAAPAAEAAAPAWVPDALMGKQVLEFRRGKERLLGEPLVIVDVDLIDAQPFAPP